jgi:hypothetical protein
LVLLIQVHIAVGLVLGVQIGQDEIGVLGAIQDIRG